MDDCTRTVSCQQNRNLLGLFAISHAPPVRCCSFVICSPVQRSAINRENASRDGGLREMNGSGLSQSSLRTRTAPSCWNRWRFICAFLVQFRSTPSSQSALRIGARSKQGISPGNASLCSQWRCMLLGARTSEPHSVRMPSHDEPGQPNTSTQLEGMHAVPSSCFLFVQDVVCQHQAASPHLQACRSTPSGRRSVC